MLDPPCADWLPSSSRPAGMEKERLHRDPRYICTATFDHSTSLAHLKLEARRRTEQNKERTREQAFSATAPADSALGSTAGSE